MKDLLRYDKMVEAALRGVVREALARAAANGLPGAHHFYITFQHRLSRASSCPTICAPSYPEEMTIVLEHQFWDLEVEEDRFSVTLPSRTSPNAWSIPFEAITAFADPAVKFGLQFQQAAAANQEDHPARRGRSRARIRSRHAKSGDKGAEVVTLDKFRKK